MSKLLLSIILGLVLTTGAEEMDESAKKVTLKVGDEAPDFSYPIEGKGLLKLSTLRDKKTVLVAFYPKAFTPGCTKQMCGYRDDFEMLTSKDLMVIAVSTDTQEQSDSFRQHFSLPYPVVGDPEAKIVRAYGVDFIGDQLAKRSVFLLDKKGKVRFVDMDYDLVNDKAALYEQVKALASGQDEPEEAAGDEDDDAGGDA